MRQFVAMFIILFNLCGDVALAQTFETFVIGGRPAKDGEYPEVVRIRSREGSTCSASYVGPKALLTAAHCVKNGQYAYPTVRQEWDYAKCTHAPDYTSQVGDQDMALCLMNNSTDVKPAIISKRKPKMGEQTTILGYGCTERGTGRGGNDGILRVNDDNQVTRESGQSYYSYHTTGVTAVCSGDSGGPNYHRVEDAFNDRHYLAGVNSRADLRYESLLTAVYHPNSIEFMENWARANNVDICGVTKDCSGNENKPNSCIEKLAALRSAIFDVEICFR